MGKILPFPTHARASSSKPKTDGSTSKPRALSSWENAQKCSGGILRLDRQLNTVDSHLTPAKAVAAAVPPTASITSSTVERVPMVPDHKSQSVSKSSPHSLRLGTRRDVGPTDPAMYTRVLAAKRLVQTQSALEMSNAAIAAALGVQSNTWAQYRTAKRTIPHNVLVGLKERFGVTADWILAGDPSGLPARLAAKMRIAA